jgi:hypothetical protein
VGCKAATPPPGTPKFSLGALTHHPRKFVSQFHTSYQGPQVGPAKAHLKTRAVQNLLTLSRAESCVSMRQGSWVVPSQGQNPALLAHLPLAGRLNVHVRGRNSHCGTARLAHGAESPIPFRAMIASFGNSSSAEARFSRRCVREDVPGIKRILVRDEAARRARPA